MTSFYSDFFPVFVKLQLVKVFQHSLSCEMSNCHKSSTSSLQKYGLSNCHKFRTSSLQKIWAYCCDRYNVLSPTVYHSSPGDLISETSLCITLPCVDCDSESLCSLLNVNPADTIVALITKPIFISGLFFEFQALCTSSIYR